MARMMIAVLALFAASTALGVCRTVVDVPQRVVYYPMLIGTMIIQMPRIIPEQSHLVCETPTPMESR